MRAQMEQTFQNLDRCLKAAGATWADVVKTNTFVTDFDEFQKCADIRMRYLGWRPRPARPSASPVSPDPIS
jgi:enamine deaminase RidA (YjgF/YER057c/UK114 family)